MAEIEEELKSFLMRVKEESKKAGLRLNIKKKKTTKIMASGLITEWQIEGEKVKVVTDFLFLGSKITADVDCIHEMWWSLLGRKAMTNLKSVLKSRGITLLTKVCIVKAMVFPVVMYSCESWTRKKAEYQRTDASELWCWRLLKVPWTVRRSNQSILREINPEYSLKDWWWSWNSSILVTWCKQLTHWKSPWCWERLRTEGEGGLRGWESWMTSPMQWTWTWANSGRCWGTGKPNMLQSMGSQRVGHDRVTEQQEISVRKLKILREYFMQK